MAQSITGPLRELTSSVIVTTSSGGSFSADGAIVLFFNTRNRTGYNKVGNGAATPSETGVTVNYSAGQRITVSFAAGAWLAGEDVYEFQVSGSLTNDPTTAQILGSVRTRGTATVGTVNYPGVGASLSSPYEVQLSTDEDLGLGVTVADSSALPANPVHGMVRYVSNPGQHWRYDSQATEGEFASGGGYWKIHYTGFSAYVADTAQAATSANLQGYKRPINQIATGIQTNVLIDPAPYLFDGTLQDATLAPLFAITNDAGASPLTQGYRVNVRLRRNGEDISTALAGQTIATLLGKVNLDDGTLDVTADGVGSPVVLGPSINGVGGLTTPEDLDPGNAWLYRLQFQSDQTAINDLASPLLQGDRITFYPRAEGRLGEREPFAAFTGSGVSEQGEQLCVLPSTGTGKAVMCSGSALIRDEDNYQGYQIPDAGQRDILLIANNTDDQRVVLNGALNDVIVRANAGAVQSYEAVRAVVGTGLGPISGYYSASSWSSPVTIAGNSEQLQISVTHPTQVRSDYPEAQIAGKTADFNPAQIVVLVRFGGTIYSVLETNRQASPQTINVTDLGATTLGSVYDSSSDPDFGLFGYGTITPSAQSGGSSLAAGSYEVAIAYLYDGGQITRISHNTNAPENCIPVADLSYFELLAARGQSGFTTTTADYTQPADASTVVVSVASSAFMVSGQPVLVEGGGTYTVDSTPSAQSVELRNTGEGGNAAQGATISSGAKITPTGTSGNSAYGFFFFFDSATSAGPSSGELRADSSDLTAAANLYVHDTSGPGQDAASLISSLTVGSKVIFRSQTASTVYMFEVSGAVVDNGTYSTVPVTYDSGSGAIDDGESLFVTGSIKGTQGIPGTNGAAATISAGTTTTINPGLSASVSNSGSSSAAVFDFSIPKGANGSPFGTKHTFDTGTGNDPASGELRLNNAAAASTTEIYVHETDRNSLSVATVLTNIPNGSRISVISDADETAIAYYSVTSSASTSNVTTLTVTHLAGTPTFADALDVTLLTEGKGDQGATGTPGADGIDGGIPYTFDSATTVGAAAGEIRLNNATPASATQIFVNTTGGSSTDYTTLWDQTNTGSVVQIQSRVAETTSHIYRIDGTAGTTERTLTVTHLGGNGGFADGDDVGLVFFFKGDTGAAGAAGADGIVTYGAITIEEVTSFPYTIVDADYGKIKHFNSATAATVNIPDSLTSPAGNQIGVRATGTGQITFAGTGSMAVNAANGLKLRTQYSAGAIILESATVCYLDGDTEV